MPDRTIDHCIHEMATAYCSQEAMRMLFLNQSSESNKALDLPAMSGIFSGLSAGKINKKIESAKPSWILEDKSLVHC